MPKTGKKERKEEILEKGERGERLPLSPFLDFGELTFGAWGKKRKEKYSEKGKKERGIW